MEGEGLNRNSEKKASRLPFFHLTGSRLIPPQKKGAEDVCGAGPFPFYSSTFPDWVNLLWRLNVSFEMRFLALSKKTLLSRYRKGTDTLKII